MDKHIDGAGHWYVDPDGSRAKYHGGVLKRALSLEVSEVREITGSALILGNQAEWGLAEALAEKNVAVTGVDTAEAAKPKKGLTASSEILKKKYDLVLDAMVSGFYHGKERRDFQQAELRATDFDNGGRFAAVGITWQTLDDFARKNKDERMMQLTALTKKLFSKSMGPYRPYGLNFDRNSGKKLKGQYKDAVRRLGLQKELGVSRYRDSRPAGTEYYGEVEELSRMFAQNVIRDGVVAGMKEAKAPGFIIAMAEGLASEFDAYAEKIKNDPNPKPMKPPTLETVIVERKRARK